MNEQVGWRGFLNTLNAEAPNYATLLPQLPRALHRYLNNEIATQQVDLLQKTLEQQKRLNFLLTIIIGLIILQLFWEHYF
jgi:ubiquinone biosynthesis protein